jgi:hypothetical protein
MTLFDQAAFIDGVRMAFAGIEHFLDTGDAFNYEEVAIFSGVVNGSQEHVITLPLTQPSVSFHTQQTLGDHASWSDVSKLSLFGFYMLSPTDCIHTLKLDTAYLIRAVSWERTEVVNAVGAVERMFVTWINRGEPTKATFSISGNIKVHLETCWTASSNEV